MQRKLVLKPTTCRDLAGHSTTNELVRTIDTWDLMEQMPDGRLVYVGTNFALCRDGKSFRLYVVSKNSRFQYAFEDECDARARLLELMALQPIAR